MTRNVILPTMYVDAVDYFPVNLELRFQGDPVQDIFAVIAINIRMDDVVESVEEFYLNVLPIENAIILTPRITVRILECKLCVLFIHYTDQQSYHLIVSKPAYLRDTLDPRTFPLFMRVIKLLWKKMYP